jgi:acyl-coenzyme A synthetase/AMP-(fatty) acid ligase
MSAPFGDHQLQIPYEPVADLLAKYARRDPDKPAIVDLDSGTAISFGQLERVVIDIAADLKRRGIRKGSRVLLLSDGNLEMLLIWLGAWRLGSVVCPFNLEMNEKQMVPLTATLGPALIVYHKEIDLARMIGDHPAPRIRFGPWSAAGVRDPEDEFFCALTPGDATQLPERNAPMDMGAIVCTSGTTARPKIIVLHHAIFWMNGLNTLEYLGLTEDDRILEYRSFGWNSPQIVTLMPFLQKGMTMHVARRFSHSRFFEWVQQHGITFSAGVPTVINMLLNKPLGTTAKDVPTLRLMSCSSAPLTAQQWTQFEEMYGLTLLTWYGMSETGWICGNRHYQKKMGTVGPPAPHQELIIVDGDGKPCPPGVEGEITVGGPQMAIGYLLDDGSIDPVLGKRMKTGDLGVQDADGFVRVTGRTKDLIIRGGVNIAPLEIDEVLIKHPDVAEAAAVGVPDKIYGEEVVCYVVAKDRTKDRALTGAGVLKHCAQHLPPAKTPKQVLFVSELPKSDRGKVLRDKLREDWTARHQLTA